MKTHPLNEQQREYLSYVKHGLYEYIVSFRDGNNYYDVDHSEHFDMMTQTELMELNCKLSEILHHGEYHPQYKPMLKYKVYKVYTILKRHEKT